MLSEVSTAMAGYLVTPRDLASLYASLLSVTSPPHTTKVSFKKDATSRDERTEEQNERHSRRDAECRKHSRNLPRCLALPRAS